MERAYDTLEVRSVNETERTFIGIANSLRVDSHSTIIDPNGAQFTLPIPLFYHERGQHTYIPFGNVVRTWIEGGKRWVEAHVPKVDASTEGSRSVANRLDAAWAEVKSGLVRGLSIDFKPIDPPDNPTRPGTTVRKWEWRGLTVVPIPSNMDASIMSVRSAFNAASGVSTLPGVSGSSTNNSPRRKMTIAEQITQFENTRAAKVAQRDALLEKSGESGTTLDAAEQETFDTLDEEVRSIDGHLARLASAQKDILSRATPVQNVTNINTASETRGGVRVTSVKPNVEPGITMARHVMALAVSNGNKYEAAEYAKRTWGDAAGEIYNGLRNGLMTRGAVAPGTTLDSTFAAPLVVTNYVTELLELLRPRTLLGRIPGLRQVPFNTSMPAQTAGGTYKWVGQGKMKPVTNAQYAAVTLGYAKASGIIVLTEELVKLSTPSAEAAVRDEMVKGIAQFLDGQLVDSSIAAVSNVNPASITNGVTGTAASGTDVADARSDIAARVGAFAAANYGLSGLVILMSESQAFALSLMVNSVGQPAFPGLSVTGGSIFGVPVVASETVGSQIVFVHAPSILYADDGGVTIDISREASVQLDSAPTEPTDASAVMTSLWQANLVGIRAERYITWGKARSTAVDRITSAAYAA